MANLRELAESYLATTLEDPNYFGLPVVLFDPNGNKQDGIFGQVLYDTTEQDPITGAPIIVRKPVVTVRRSTLNRIPITGETWAVQIPDTPSLTGTLVTYNLLSTEDGKSLGMVRLYLGDVVQSP